jgi:IclR family transcriptional regulator, KDG regulon repressor
VSAAPEHQPAAAGTAAKGPKEAASSIKPQAEAATERSMMGAQVVDRVADILEAFLRHGPELGVGEVSRVLDLKKATAHRLLSALRRRNFLTQDPASRRYRLGMKLWELGSAATRELDWVAQVKPHLERLTERTGETSHLAILDAGQVLYIESAESSRSVRMPSQVGRRVPFWSTALGKALVAHLTEDVVAGLVSRQSPPQVKDAEDLERLYAELAEIRSRGYVVDYEGLEEGLFSVAVPVRNYTGHVIAAISLTGPSSRVAPDELKETAQEVLATGREISVELGCPTGVLIPVMVK